MRQESASLAFPTSSSAYSNAWLGPNFDADPTATPEPGTYALIAAGLGALALLRRRS
jgi:hypothetical protein